MQQKNDQAHAPVEKHLIVFLLHVIEPE